MQAVVLEPMPEKGPLKIIAKAFSQSCYIYVTDNGIGIPSEKLKEISLLLQQNPEIQLHMIFLILTSSTQNHPAK